MESNLTSLYVVRHAESKGNVGLGADSNVVGDLGSSLTDTGRNQSIALTTKLKDIPFDAVFASPMNRAQETAEALAVERRLEVQTRESLRERVRGNLQGQDEKELRKSVSHLFGNPGALTDEEMWSWKLFDDMESAEEAVSRMITELREIAVAYPGKTVLVVTHGNIMRALLVHLGLGSFKEFSPNTVKNTGYVLLESDGVDFFVKETYLIDKNDSTGGKEE